MIYLAASVAWSDSSQMAKRKEKKIEKEKEEQRVGDGLRKQAGKNYECGPERHIKSTFITLYNVQYEVGGASGRGGVWEWWLVEAVKTKLFSNALCDLFALCPPDRKEAKPRPTAHTHTHTTQTHLETHTHMLMEGDSSRTLAKPRQMLWPFRMTKLVFGQRRLPTQIVWSLIGNSQCSCPAARTAMLCSQAANCKGRAHSSLHLSACISLSLSLG